MYDDWTYADRDAVRARRQQAVQEARARRQQREQGTPVAPYASRLNTLSAPVAPAPEPSGGGGGGLLGGLKKLGTGALGVLDAATETTTDIADTFVGGPGSAALKLAGGDWKGAARDFANPLDMIPGVRAFRKGVVNPAAAGEAPGAVRALKPGDYLRRQREDYEKRPLAQQLATGVLLDPTNVIGGMGAAKGLRAAAKGRGAVAGKVLRGAAKVDEFAETAQSKAAREVLGGTVGMIGNQVAGGEDVTGLEWWQAAALGALGGHFTRGAKAPIVRVGEKATGGGFGGSVIQDASSSAATEGKRLLRGPQGHETYGRGVADKRTQYPMRHRVVEMDELLPSNLDTGEIHPDYPQELQPRDRTTVESKAQVDKIAREMDPDSLIGDAKRLDEGAPIVSEDGVVESGNGRVLGLRRAREMYPQNYEAYRKALIARAKELGLNPAEIEAMQHPMVVRERTQAMTPEERISFVREANMRGTAEMNATDRAFVEADFIHDTDFGGFVVREGEDARDALNANRNAEFRKRFLARLSEEERNALTKDGQLTQQGADRLAGAMFAKTFPSDAGKRLLTTIFQSTDETVQNVKRALLGMTPRLAKLESGVRAGLINPEYAIADDLAVAVEKLAQLRAEGLKAEDYLFQSHMFAGGGHELTPMQQALLAALEGNKRSAKAMADLFGRYMANVELQPPPGQAGMFGAGSVKTREELMQSAIRAGGQEMHQTAFDLGAPEMRTKGAGVADDTRDVFGNPVDKAPGQNPPNSPDPVPDTMEGSPIPEEQIGDSAPATQSGAVARTETPGPEFANEPPPSQSAPPPREGPFRAKEEPKAKEGPKAPPKEEAPPRQPPPPLDTTNDFTTLGLDPNKTYTIKEVQKAYRERMKQYHPDVGGTDAEAKAINAAFQRFKLGRETRGGPQAASGGRGPGSGAPPPPPPGSRSGPEWHSSGTGPEDFDPDAFARSRGYRDWNDFEAAGTSRGSGGVGAGAGARTSGSGSAPPNAGVPPRGASGGPSSPPPPPPGAPPPPPRGPATGTPGANPKDLFMSKPRSEQLRDFDAWAKTWRGKVAAAVREVAAALGGEKLDLNVKLDRLIHPFKQELNRIQNFRSSFLEQVDLIRADANKAGLRVKQTATGWRLEGFAGNPAFEDVIEQATPAGQRAWAALTPEQRAVMDRIKALNQDINDTVKFHGGDLRLDPDIDGTYFPRIVLDKDGIPKATGANPNSAAFGRKQGHNRTRAFESLEEGLAAGYNYDDPWSALRAGWDSKLRTAQDAYVHNLLSPLQTRMRTPPWGAREIRGHPAFAGETFDADVADKIEAMLSKGHDNVFSTVPKTINAALTPLRAGFDFSAWLQQGAGFMVRHPIEGTKMFAMAIKSMRDPEAYYKMMRRLDAQGPGLDYLQQVGWKTRGATEEELMFPRLAAKLSKGKVNEIPLLGKAARGFNEQFSRTLNMMGAHEANLMHERLLKRGLTGRALDDEMMKGMNSVNRMMGWTATKPTLIENVGVFAPRYTRATIEQLGAALTKGGIEGSMARRHLGSLLGAGGVIAYGWNTLNGHDTDFDPRSPNFLRLRDVGGLDVSPFGSYDVLMRAVAGTFAGEEGDSLNPLESFNPGRAGKAAWAKLSPTAKALWETFGSKETYLGEPLDTFGSPEGFVNSVKQQVKSSLPFGAQNLIEEGPVAAAVGSTGLSSNPLTASERRDMRRDEVARKQFGRGYGDLSGEQKSRVNEDTGVQKWTREGQEQALKRSGDFAKYTQVQKTAREQLAAAGRFFTQGRDDTGKKYGGKEYRDAVHDIEQRRMGALSTLSEFKQDGEISRYFKLYDDAKRLDGSLDYDKLDRLQAAYKAEHPGVQAKVDGIVGANDDPVMRELRAARKSANAFYQIPRYRGMTLEEGNEAAGLMGQLNDLVRFGQARNRAMAYRLLEEANPGARALVRKALARGVNPERKAYLKAHPEMAKFYSDAPVAAA